MDNNPSRVIIGTTMSTGELSVYLVINNSDEIFGAPGTPSLAEVIATLTGIIAKNNSINNNISEDQAFNEIEVHMDCGFTTAQVPDLLDQFTHDDVTYCQNHCADHAWHL